MKITFIISSLGSGGAERVVSTLANNFSKNHHVYIITFSNDDPFYDLNQNIVHIKLDILKNSENRLESIKNSFKRILILKKTLKEINADINISFMTHTNILAVIASKLNHQKIIISERIEYDFYQSKLLNKIRKLIYSKANFLIVQTLADKKNYDFLSNIEVIYNPLELPNIQAKREKTILAAGRMDKQKGFDKLIDAFLMLKNTQEWKLCIVGDGAQKENLQYKIETLNMKNIELAGKRKDIFEWYAKSSIFVLSSEKEGFPDVLLEAMGCGCACISFDCPNGPNEIIENGVNGILVENQNIEKLAQSMQMMIDDSGLRGRLSKEAQKTIEKYNIVNISIEWENIIQKVLTK
jgi:GalNAc-alpha-(1->4)-GalNAc-alpha-(1->3)-diNAcBac-PP-undecaprenol alpha-1,4-N-acetyl-D-galactosaminyltransferase